MDEALLKVHLTPRGSKDQIVGWRGDTLHVKITAPPVEGAANAALVRFVAKSLGVRNSQVRLVSGQKSREKSLSVAGLAQSDLHTRLDKHR